MLNYFYNYDLQQNISITCNLIYIFIKNKFYISKTEVAIRGECLSL